MKSVFYFILILPTYILTGCSNTNNFSDDFGLEIGMQNSSWKDQIEKLKKENGFSIDKSDSTTLRGFYTIGDKKIPVSLMPNHYSYQFGNLRELFIEFAPRLTVFVGSTPPDTKCNRILVDSVFYYLKETYGQPDSVSNPRALTVAEYSKIVKSNKPKSFQEWATEGSGYFGNSEESKYRCSIAIWKLKDYQIIIERNYPFNRNDSSFYFSASIEYISNTLETEEKILRDSIRKTLKPQHLIYMDIKQPIWNSINGSVNEYSCTIGVGNFRRTMEEETRCVTSFKYEVILLDTYNDTLYVLKDLEYPTHYDSGVSLCMSSYGQANVLLTITPYTIQYYSNSEYSQGLEKGRNNFRQVKTTYSIKAVVFEDGTVLK